MHSLFSIYLHDGHCELAELLQVGRQSVGAVYGGGSLVPGYFEQRTVKKVKMFLKIMHSSSPLLLVLLEGGDVAGVGVGETCATDKNS